MKQYPKPELEIIRFRLNDVISASGEGPAECPIDYCSPNHCMTEGGPNCDTQGNWVCGID